jgi:hypothetical protein
MEIQAYRWLVQIFWRNLAIFHQKKNIASSYDDCHFGYKPKLLGKTLLPCCHCTYALLDPVNYFSMDWQTLVYLINGSSMWFLHATFFVTKVLRVVISGPLCCWPKYIKPAAIKFTHLHTISNSSGLNFRILMELNCEKFVISILTRGQKSLKI